MLIAAFHTARDTPQQHVRSNAMQKIRMLSTGSAAFAVMGVLVTLVGAGVKFG